MKIEHSIRVGAFLIVASLIAVPVNATEVFALPSSATNKWQLQVQQSPAPSNQWGRLKLIAESQALFGDGIETVSGPGVRVNGEGATVNASNNVRLLEKLGAAEWEYARLDLTPGYADRLARFHRHLLFVHPDLFVVYDDIEARQPSTFAISISSPLDLAFDQRSGNFQLATPKAELTAHVLLSGKSDFQKWEPLADAPATNRTAARAFQITTANQLQELRYITALKLDSPDKKTGVGFKLLQGETAIGARIWRAGLPTLIAFRARPDAGEADLIGLKFSGALAVDVFKPRVRTPRLPQTQPKEK